MPQTKKVTKKISSRKPTAAQLLQTEIRYFKGLSLLLLSMLVVVFFTFSALFAGMIAETQYRYEQLVTSYDSLATSVTDMSHVLDILEDDSSQEYIDAIVDTADASSDYADWLVFEKYDITITFPKNWTYLDQPFAHGREIHFFVDGTVRDDLSTGVGDMYIAFVSEMDVPKNAERQPGVVVSGIDSDVYVVDEDNMLEEIVYVPREGGFVSVHFRYQQDGKEVMSRELREKVLDGLVIR